MKQQDSQPETGKPTHATITVSIHFGAEHVSFDVPSSTTLSAIKTRAMSELNVPTDPNFDYIIRYESEDITDETQTLATLLGAHPRPRVEFHLKKRPKGGRR